MKKLGKLFALCLVFTMILTWSTNCLAQSKEIRFWSDQTEPWQQEVIGKIISKFEELNPDVKVNVEYLSWEDFNNKLVSALATGTEPEVSLFAIQYSATLPAEGVLVPLDDVLEELGGQDAFFESALSISRYKDGKYYTLPYSTLPVLLWYRKDIFEKYNVEPPKTWEDLYEAAKILTEKTPQDMYGIGLPYGRNEWTDGAFRIIALWPAGGKVLDEDENVIFDSLETQKALEYYKSLYPFTPPGSESWSYFETMNSYVTGITAMTLYYGRILVNLKEYSPDILANTGAIIPPKNKYQATVNSPQTIGVFKNSNYPELGKEFLKYFLTSEFYAELLWATPGHSLPVLKAAVNDWRKHPLLEEYPEILDTLLKSIQPGIGFAETKEPGIEKVSPCWMPIRGSDIIPDAIQKVTLNNEKVEEVTAWTAKELKKVISEYKQTN